MNTLPRDAVRDASAESTTAAPLANPAPFVRRSADGHDVLDLMVENLHCAGCIARIERALLAVPGVEAARVNMSTRRLKLAWRAGEADAASLATLVRDLGYPVAPYDPEALMSAGRDESRMLLRALAVAGFAAGNVMLLSISVWAGAWSGMGEMTRGLFHWVSALIALPALAYAIRPFARSALAALGARTTNMDVPITLAVMLAATAGLAETLRGGEHVYFDAGVTLLFFLLVGRYLDRRARASARSAAEHLLALSGSAATVIAADGTRFGVAASELRAGMRVLVAAGDRVPADGMVRVGTTEIDVSLVTGETIPVRAAPGARIFAGTLNVGAPVEVEVLAAGDDTLLAEIVRLMEAAEQGRARYVRLADRVARLYAPAVHVLAAATFAAWIVLGATWYQALLVAVAVLIITCPCALGLAVPAVQVVASGRLLRMGVLLKAADGLERLAQADTVVFDKTGTLTLGRPELLERPADDDLAAAAALARASRHPLAQAVVRAAQGRALPEAREVAEVPGLGLAGMVAGEAVRIGRGSWCGAPATERAPALGECELWLKRADRAPCRFAFADRLRADARATVDRLRARGLRVELLSGDRKAVVQATAQALGIEAWRAECLPADKVAHLEGLAASGRKVAMVGDGLNDAPALAAGFVSLSPASAADISQTAADVVFQGEGLAPVADALKLARRADRLVRQNLALAILYNALAVPLAMAGLATPLIAAVAMSASSLLVTLNALRLGLAAAGGDRR